MSKANKMLVVGVIVGILIYYAWTNYTSGMQRDKA